MPPRRSGSGPMTASTAQPAASASFSPLPASNPPSPIVAKLRKMWQFAVVCQFMHTFDEAFGLSGFETEALERDLDGEETAFIPDLMRRLLYTLTLDRRVSIENWQDKARNQFLKREPQNNPLGTFEEPRVWDELPLTQKVEVLKAACEWHFQDSERFRKLVKSEEDAESWRIEPIGWDAKGNTYWLFDDNRLWIQYAPPPRPVPELPPASKGTKRARAEARRAAAEAKKAGALISSKASRDSKSSKSKSVASSVPSSLKGGKAGNDEEEEGENYEEDTEDEDEEDDGRIKKRLRTRTSKAAPLPRRNSSRSAAVDATKNIKRNARETAGALIDSQTSPSRRTGMRSSRRLRGGGDGSDGEWESIPEELLKERKVHQEKDQEGEDAEDDDSLSDPPSGDEDEEEEEEEEEKTEEQKAEEAEEGDADQMEVDPSSEDDDKPEEPLDAAKETQAAQSDVDANGDSAMLQRDGESTVQSRIDEKVDAEQGGKIQDGDQMHLDQQQTEGSEVKAEEAKIETGEEKRQQEEDKVEFETVAVTLSEWDAIITQFSTAKHPDEKNLYKFLKEEIYPKVTEELKELEKARAQEMLMASRKRSSRIAIKESEKEEKERDRIARLSMEDRLSGVRAEEDAEFSKEDLAKQRELEKERKIKEREERVLAREREAYEKARQEELERVQKEAEREVRQRRRDELIANGGDMSALNSPEPSHASSAATAAPRPIIVGPKKRGRPSSSKQMTHNVQQAKGKKTEDWVLSCEVCGSRGKNMQEASQIVCCEKCGIWQHVKCWNNQDKRMGAEALRKWSEIDFYCSKCRPPADPNFMPPYPNSKPLPKGFVVQKLKRPPRSKNSSPRYDGKGKETEEGRAGTPNGRKPRVSQASTSSASASGAGAASPNGPPVQAPAQAQPHLPSPLANQAQPVPQHQSAAQYAIAPNQYGLQHQLPQPGPLPSQSNAQPSPSASASFHPSVQSHTYQHQSAIQPSSGHPNLGSLPPPHNLNNASSSSPTVNGQGNTVNGLGTAFVHQAANQSSSLNGVPRSISNHPNSVMSPRSPSSFPRSNPGSFPIRRDVSARSPLSRPYDSPTDVPPLTIGRPQSPTPSSSHSRNGSASGSSSAMTPLQRGVAASSNPSPTFIPNGSSVNGDRNEPLYQRQVAAPSPSLARSEGPGPTSGSIRPRMPSDPSKQFGPSPPRQLYGSSDRATSSSHSLNGTNGMAPPSTRPIRQPTLDLANQTTISQSSSDDVPMQVDSTASNPNIQQQQQQSESQPPPSL